MGYRFYSHEQTGALISKEVGNGNDHRSDGYEQQHIAHEIRKHHQNDPADERNRRPLLSAIDEETQPDRAVEQTPKQPRLNVRTPCRRSQEYIRPIAYPCA